MSITARQLRLSFSAILTLLILSLPLDNYFKTLLFLINWFVWLRPFSWVETVTFIIININIVIMEVQVVQKGYFSFTQPDVWGLPLWEFFMWGYFGLVSSRLCPNITFHWSSAIWALLFSSTFQFVTDQFLLFVLTLILTISMVIHFGRSALRIGIFALVFGCIFEWLGLATQQWQYSHSDTVLQFPLWGLTMWAGSQIIFSHFLAPGLRLIYDKYLHGLKFGSEGRT